VTERYDAIVVGRGNPVLRLPFDWLTLAGRLPLIGGSYVGLKSAQMYGRFGAEEMAPRLISREDEEVSAAVKEILESEGIRIRLNAECISVAR
jgi:pyruvate/2-oxoglutarate dehydrogenase complex dihydrolipoamide dehydrogenase (E3) component